MITIREGRLMWETNSNIEKVWIKSSPVDLRVYVLLKSGEEITTKEYPISAMDDAVDEADKLVKEKYQ